MLIAPLIKPELVSSDNKNNNKNTNYYQQQQPHSSRNRPQTPSIPKLKLVSFHLSRSTSKHTTAAEEMILTSRRNQWGTDIQWFSNNTFCSRRKIDIFQSHVNEITNFLTNIFESRVGYTCCCMVHPVLNTIVTIDRFPDIP